MINRRRRCGIVQRLTRTLNKERPTVTDGMCTRLLSGWTILGHVDSYVITVLVTAIAQAIAIVVFISSTKKHATRHSLILRVSCAQAPQVKSRVHNPKECKIQSIQLDGDAKHEPFWIIIKRIWLCLLMRHRYRQRAGYTNELKEWVPVRESELRQQRCECDEFDTQWQINRAGQNKSFSV